ncbi:MAG TPA: flagellin [Devosia sp.]|nr:flagellin [Devosia sp.]
MSDITLSAAVRSNLLSLQNTASLLDTTQTRLATGNKVNSALDNPTSYFTAASLNARASDLGNLLDSVSNAIQTIQAANDGITSITKLVESAQATANQAQQLSETVTTTTAATSGSLTGGAFSTVDISGGTDSITFNLSVDGGSATAITIDSAAVTAYNTANSTTLNDAALSAADIVALINDQAGANIASVSGGAIKFTSTTTGTTSNITITGYTATVTGGSTGIANGNNSGSAATSTSGPNPARGALISQYNGLLDQIDQLTADAGYNGNNLLAGSSTQLKVVFNEQGTSSLTISGKDASSAGLGLSKLTLGTEFDTNASITTILAKLKTAQDTLRSDASSFGSNLSIVQTRQDFTKALINTLQTGASNLTLADSNEEAANLLALQTRQSLSTKALSLASQGDQNVLRLLQ